MHSRSSWWIRSSSTDRSALMRAACEPQAARIAVSLSRRSLSSRAPRGICCVRSVKARSKAATRCARWSLSLSGESNQRPLRRTLADAMKPHRYPALLSEHGPARTRTSMCSDMRALLPLLLPVLGSLYGARSRAQQQGESSNYRFIVIYPNNQPCACVGWSGGCRRASRLPLQQRGRSWQPCGSQGRVRAQDRWRIS